MHDVVMRNGTVYDGEGGMPYAADVAIDGDRITAVMPLVGDRGRREIDAAGLAVAPRFHQHAVLGDAVADRRWPSSERRPAGRDARGTRRGVFDGTAYRRDAAGPHRT